MIQDALKKVGGAETVKHIAGVKGGDYAETLGIEYPINYSELHVKMPLKEIIDLIASWIVIKGRFRFKGKEPGDQYREACHIGADRKLKDFHSEFNYHPVKPKNYGITVRIDKAGWHIEWVRLCSYRVHESSPAWIRVKFRADILKAHKDSFIVRFGESSKKPSWAKHGGTPAPDFSRELIESAKLAPVIRRITSAETAAFVADELKGKKRTKTLVLVPDEGKAPSETMDLEFAAKNLHAIAEIVWVEDPACMIDECKRAGLVLGKRMTEGIIEIALPPTGGVPAFAKCNLKAEIKNKVTDPKDYFLEFGNMNATITNMVLEKPEQKAQLSRIVHAQRLCANVFGCASSRAVPDGFFDGIKHIDQARSRERVEHLISSSKTHQVSQEILEQAFVELSALKDENTLLLAENDKLSKENRDLMDVNDELESRVSGLDAHLGSLMSGSAFKTAEVTDSQLENIFASVMGGEPTLEEALIYFQHCFPSRVVVHKKALASAREGERFLYKAKAFGLLRKLVMDYWNMLSSGQGNDTKAKEIFGADCFASHENELTEANGSIGRQRRTFTHNGDSIFMGTHLKIGNKASQAETLRIHFHWDAKDRKIIIGHCGKHLSFD